jgi:predicted membrane-bound spermidine synthase
MSDKIFADGFHFDKARENAPTFVLGRISVRVNDAIAFLNEHKNERGFVTIDVKESKGGKVYCELDTYQLTKRPVEEINPDDIPF